jgi:hypothetical protein
MDVERIIDEIEQLQEMFEAPDIRPLSASELAATISCHRVRSELRHNIEVWVPSRTTSPLLLLITSLIRTRATIHPAPASDARCAVGRPVRMTCGLAPAGMSGTRSIPEGCARRASTSGRQLSASSVAVGRRIRTGTRNNQISTCSVCPRTIPRTGHFNTVSELKPRHTLYDSRG